MIDCTTAQRPVCLLTTALVGTMSLAALTGCYNRPSVIDPAPPEPLAAGFSPEQTTEYEPIEPYQYEQVPVDVTPVEPTPLTEPEVVQPQPEPTTVLVDPLKDESPLKDGNGSLKDGPVADVPNAPLKDGGGYVGGDDPLKDGGAPVSAGGVTHVVQDGDSLWVISKRYYGTGMKWEQIAAANPGIDPKRLRIGQKIRIP